tara:strand:- start:217 stop:375 length:159 start_codon:yes stop_codon:yes gene_type:complete
MFENVYGCPDPNGFDNNLIATGHYIKDSHYLVVLQDSNGEVIDLCLTEVGFE